VAYYLQDEIKEIHSLSKEDARQWRKDYPEYERLADNGLIEDIDEYEPETNDGSLSAALFKLPKRVLNRKLEGRAKALDASDAWITELANIEWKNRIIPNANTQAPFIRKWKDAVRKSAIYGGQPLITLFVKDGGIRHGDFVVPQAQDVILEAGKISDYDSDIFFWEVYYSKKQAEDILEQAKEDTDEYSTWDTKALQEIIDSLQEEERETDFDHSSKKELATKKNGIKFVVVFQRGKEAPFYMWHEKSNKVIREWPNPDPTGDVPVHYLYCYQDFINPYGIGIVKLAGGTQNVLDYMRRQDVLATQLGIRPPKLVEGNADDVDEDSMVYVQDANWYVGGAKVTRMEIANGVYNQLPQRIQMYQSSLNKHLPMGDTSVSAAAGDPLQSKTPAGVRFQEANLSIDDDDFKDNLYMTYEAVSKSIINTHFANMQGSDLLKLTDEERDILSKSGIEFPMDEFGNPTNELEVIWDNARAEFDFEMDAEADTESDKQKRIDALLKVYELSITDPMVEQKLLMARKKLDVGELLSTIISLNTDNKKILVEAAPEDMAMGEEMMAGQMGEQTDQMAEPAPQDDAQELQVVMDTYGVDEQIGMAVLELIRQGTPREEIEAQLAEVANG